MRACYAEKPMIQRALLKKFPILATPIQPFVIMKPIYLLWALFLGTSSAHAQSEYASADAAARRIGKEKFDTPAALAKELCKDLPEELQKARAIFTWVAENVRYDLSMVGQEGPDARTTAEYESKRIKAAYRRCRGVCMDFALLYREMALAVGLECVYISGNCKSSVLGGWSSHAWNAVKIGGKWQLVDATWGSGHSEDNKYYRHFQPGYFCTEPRLFLLDHFPEEEKWQLLETPIGKSAFKKQIAIDYGDPANGILDAEPFGPLHKNADGKITLRLKVDQPAQVYRLVMNGRDLPFEYTTDKGWLQFVFKPNAGRQLQVWAGKKNKDGTNTTLFGIFPVGE